MLRSLSLAMCLFTLNISNAFSESGSFSDFLILTDETTTRWYDGTVLNGPVRSNGLLGIFSSTPGRDNDPWFYTLSSAMDSFYTVLPDTFEFVMSTLPHPPGTNLWIEPYELMSQGPPWFNLGVDTIPFGHDNVNWQFTFDAASDYGLVISGIQDGARVIFKADSILLKESEFSPVNSYCISDLQEPVIWLDNLPTDFIYIRSMPPDSGSGITVPVMVGCNGDVYVMGNICYEPVSGGMLGLITVYGDMLIADTPDYDDWNGIWAIETEKEMTCSGSFLIIDGMFCAENPWQPHPAVTFNLHGGIQMVEEYITAYVAGSNTWGYFIEFDYDQRLFTASPPFYPTYDTGTGIENDPEIETAEPLIQVQGNPFRDNLFITITSDVITDLDVRILDISGRVMREIHMTEEQSIPASDLPCGTYILTVESSDGAQQSIKVIKI